MVLHGRQKYKENMMENLYEVLVLSLIFILGGVIGYSFGVGKGWKDGRESWARVFIEKNNTIQDLRSALDVAYDVIRHQDYEEYQQNLINRTKV